MTWFKHPGNVRFLTFEIDDLWVGEGSDYGRLAYKINMDVSSKYVITQEFIGFYIKIDGTVLEPVFSDVKGEW